MIEHEPGLVVCLISKPVKRTIELDEIHFLLRKAATQTGLSAWRGGKSTVAQKMEITFRQCKSTIYALLGD